MEFSGRACAGPALATIVALALAAPAGAFEAIVYLPDGRPAADARVLLLGQTGGARTGPDGRFSWVPEPRVPFQVLVVLPGDVNTAPILVEELPTDGSSLVLTVQLAATDTVTVEAGASPHTEAPPANAATLVLQEDITQRRPPNLTESISSLPGAGRVGEGVAAVPSLRGLARGRTLVLIDGARVTSERRAGPSATFLDPATLEAVEVVRGPGSVAWGADAFGGVIHARTRKAPHGGGWAGRVDASLGAGVPQGTVMAEVARGLGDGGVLVAGRHREGGDYRSPAGTIPGSAYRDSGFRVQAHHEVGPGRLAAGWQSDLGRDLGKPSSEWDLARTVYPIEDSHRLTLSYDGDPIGALNRWWVDGFLGSSRLVTDRVAEVDAASERRSSDIRARDYGLRASGAGAAGRTAVRGGIDLNGRVGLEALQTLERQEPGDGSTILEQGVAIEDASRHDLGAWFTLERRLLPRLLLSAGLRFDRVTTRNVGGYFGDRDTRHDSLSGALGLVGGPVGSVTVTGQVSRGFRDPTLSERYFRGVTGRGFVTGNPDLDPEKSLQYDVAIRRPGRVRAALYLYRYEIRDLAERYREGPDFLFRNRGRALLRGVELELQADLGGGFAADLALQAAEGRALDDGAPLADVPAEGLTLSVRRGFGEAGVVWARALFRARRDDPGPVEREVPAFGVLDLGGVWRATRGLELRLVAGNVFDTEYLSSPDELAVAAPGRSIVATVSARF
ncbi:MAG: TonB-dependent receptor [Acidobacteriota bacterium]|jgi:iron complex outermembrane receptor protein